MARHDNARPRFASRPHVVAAIVAALLSAGLLSPSRVAAAPKSSLDWVPADASVYASFLRGREQVEAIAGSNWWEKLKAVPAVQLGWNAFLQEWNSGPGQEVERFLADPENKELLDLGVEMLSDEIFFYADARTAELFDVYMDASHASSAITYVQLVRMTQGLDFEAVQRISQLQMGQMLAAVTKDVTKLRAPEMIVGFRIKNAERAKSQLDRLEKLAELLAEEEPMFRNRIKRVRVGSGDFLSLTLSGDMVPWDELAGAENILDEEGIKRLEKLIAHLKTQEISLSVGIYEGYVLVHVGQSPQSILKLGKGSLLRDHAALEPHQQFYQQRVTGASYVSEKMMRAMTYADKDIDEIVRQFRGASAEMGLDEAETKRILNDVDELAKDLKKYIPEYGPASAISMLTSRGRESYTYNWTKSKMIDASRPLSVLDHVGESPLLVIAGRNPMEEESYALAVKWITKAHGYFERFALPQMGESEREFYGIITQRVFPILKRADKITREDWLPAFADGESAWVVDAADSSKQWIKMLPPTEQALPVPSFAAICAVRDEAKLKKALGEYYEVASDIVDTVVTFSQGQLPPLKLPAPVKKTVAAGEVHSLPLPMEAGLDDRVAPSVGIGKGFAVFSLLSSQAERLLEAKPIKREGPLVKAGKPLAGVVYINFAGLVETSTQWIETGVNFAAASGELDGEIGSALILGTVKQVGSLLKAVPSYSSVTYVKDGVTVTHSELRIVDLQE